jgi:adenylate cyclase
VTVQDWVFPWLLAERTRPKPPAEMIAAWADALVARGVPLSRLSAWMPTAHPELWGTQVLWTPAAGAKTILRPHEIVNTSAYRDSPGEAVLEAGSALRWRMRADDPDPKLPILRELHAEGATDYVIAPFDLGGPLPGWLAYATADADGFTDDVAAALVAGTDAVGLHLAWIVARDATRSLLRTYLGRNAADRVIAGEFRRGTGVPIDAALWFCDLRGFTSLGDSLPPRELVALLDRYFAAVADPIEDHGGEVLKFIGDAVLATFPFGDDPASACRRALAAAEAGLAALNAVPPLKMGVALHAGEVLYGNIGGRARLDFTVIGAAVNEVTRVESLSKGLGVPLLLTGRFAGYLDRELVPLGAHALRGVSEPTPIFTLPGYARP